MIVYLLMKWDDIINECFIKYRKVKKLMINEPILKTNSSKIYMLQEDKKYKEFTSSVKILSLFFHADYKTMEESLYKQVTIQKCNVYSFPRKLVFYGRKLCGYIANYEIGKQLCDIDIKIKLMVLMDLLKKLEEDTKNISELGCLIQDLHGKNILISDSSIKVIDTDYYYFPTDRKYQSIYDSNMRKIFINVVHNILPNLFSSCMCDEKIKDQYYGAVSGKIKLSEFLEYLILRMENNEGINSIDDLYGLRKVLLLK